VGAGGGGAGEAPQRPSLWWIVLFAVPGALLAALAISAQTYLSMLGHGHSFRAIFAWQLCCWTIWALAAPAVIHAGTLLLESRRSRGATLLHIGALGVGLVVFHVTVTAQLTVWFQPYVPYMPASYREAFAAQSWALLPIDTLTFVLLVIIGWALAVHYRARYLEFRESRLEAELARAHLDALRLEIQPHFLFNTLNAISALIRRHSNERALEMLIRLSELMRKTLDRTQEPLLSLDSELAFTRQYVELQQARFADRLEVCYDIDPGCLDIVLPAFLFQPLVENAIRHGPARRAAGCWIEIGARRESDGGMHVWVADDGVGLPSGFDLARDAGTGIGNIRSRLLHLYGADARLEVGRRAEGGTRVDVIVPRAPTELDVRIPA